MGCGFHRRDHRDGGRWALVRLEGVVRRLQHRIEVVSVEGGVRDGRADARR